MKTQCSSPPKIEKQWVAIANSKLDSFVIKDFIGTTGETWMQPADLQGSITADMADLMWMAGYVGGYPAVQEI